jgi:hypothetical protein
MYRNLLDYIEPTRYCSILDRVFELSNYNEKIHTNYKLIANSAKVGVTVKFVRFAWFNLADLNWNSPDWRNSGIRPPEEITEWKLDELRNSILRDFDDREIVPAVTLDGYALDGRTRMEAMATAGIEWCVVAVYEAQEISKMDKKALSFALNYNGKPKNGSDPEHLPTMALKGYKEGEIEKTGTAIRAFFEKCQLQELIWDGKPESLSYVKGKTTRLVNKALKDMDQYDRDISGSPTGESLVSLGTSKKYAKLITEDFPGWKVHSDRKTSIVEYNTVLINYEQYKYGSAFLTDSLRTYFKKLEEYPDTGPLQVILYPGKLEKVEGYDGSDQRLARFLNHLDKYYNDAFALVQWAIDNSEDEDTAAQTKLNAKGPRPFEIVGTVPCIEGRPSHMSDDEFKNTIIPIDPIVNEWRKKKMIKT